MGPVRHDPLSAVPEASPPSDPSLVAAEYSALREELLKRIELNHQVISIAVFALGTLLAAGVQIQNAEVVLVYPLLAMLLSGVWAYNERRSQRIQAYIRDRIEARVGQGNMGWEHALARSRLPHRRFALGWMVCFLGVEFIAIVVGWSVARMGSPSDALATFLRDTTFGERHTVLATLLALDALSVLVTIVMLRPRSAIETPPLQVPVLDPALAPVPSLIHTEASLAGGVSSPGAQVGE